ncbi:Prolamin-like protein [Carex littledalei]|uniref:Prolamin-like protein n=1 Tax=Carex littledalei TaxID=544730 RepID=A0A833VT68_9POAL|nr:Prolamin-like protein [Carex littledalei]
MARSAMAAFILLLVLIAITTTSTSASMASTSAPAPAPAVELQEDPLFLIFPQGGDIAPCLKSIMKVEGCAISLLTSVLNNRLDVSKPCCHAIVSAGDSCLPILNSFLRPHIQSFCGVAPNPAPPLK